MDKEWWRHPKEDGRSVVVRDRNGNAQYWSWATESWQPTHRNDWLDPSGTTYEETWCEPEAPWGGSNGS